MKAALKPSAYIAANEWEAQQETNPDPLSVEDCIIGFETQDLYKHRVYTIALTAWCNGEIVTDARQVTGDKFRDVKGALAALWSSGKAKTNDLGKHYRASATDVVRALNDLVSARRDVPAR